MSGVDQIMRLADEWYAHGQTSHSGIDEKYAALRAAVEQVIAENLQRGNVIGRIAAHLLGRQNNVTDEDVVVAAARIGGELLGANTRAKRAEDDLMAAHNAVALAQPAQAVPSDVERDAARYRILADNCADEYGEHERRNREVVLVWAAPYSKDWRRKLDAEVDSMLAAAPEVSAGTTG